MTDNRELYYAHMEADRRESEDAYFKARPLRDTADARFLFRAGYERAYDKLWPLYGAQSTTGEKLSDETNESPLCPNCESAEVGTFTFDNWFLYGVEKQYRLVAKNVLFFRCMACSLEYTGEDGEQKRDEAVRAHLARVAASEVSPP